MSKMKIEAIEPADYAISFGHIDSFLKFMKAHNAEHDLEDPIERIPLWYAKKVVNELGYNIEVTEVSAANRAFGSIKGKDWHRTHEYRWSIVYWDENGTMISLTHSDNNNDHNFYTSEDAALRNAIDYIADNYKKLEE